MINNQILLEKINELTPYMKETRIYLHQHPELSSQEYETAEFLKKEIQKLGLPIIPVKGTGFFAILDTGKPGKTVALRTDIDALPIQENPNNLKGPRKWISKNDGVAHMCGHDGHMAVLLAAMKLLVDIKDDLQGRVLFLFEEGEEIGSGIEAMLDGIKDQSIDAIYGTHLTSFMPTGQICLDSGPRMAGAIVIDFEVIGRSGHGSRPDLSINPIFAASAILNGLTSAWANQLDVSKTVTLGLTQFHAGTVNNVIPEKARISGSLRYFDLNEGKKAFDVFKYLTEKTASAHLCTVEFSNDMKIATIPVYNDDKLSLLAREGVKELYPEKLVTGIQWYASESFSHYEKIAPSVFAFVGIGNEELGSGAEHHNDRFDMDDDAMPYSLGSTVKFAVNFLNENANV